LIIKLAIKNTIEKKKNIKNKNKIKKAINNMWIIKQWMSGEMCLNAQ
jgi:hypothetical protein